MKIIALLDNGKYRMIWPDCFVSPFFHTKIQADGTVLSFTNLPAPGTTFWFYLNLNPTALLRRQEANMEMKLRCIERSDDKDGIIIHTEFVSEGTIFPKEFPTLDSTLKQLMYMRKIEQTQGLL